MSSVELDDVQASFINDQALPLVVTPKGRLDDPVGWAHAHRDALHALLLRHRGMLFRGLDIDCIAQFRDFMTTVTPRMLDAHEAPTPRRKLAQNVFTSTEYPPQETIALHNEMSYAARWPDYLWFYCDLPPAQGGETPIASSSLLYERVPAEIRQAFEERGLTYRRTYHQRGDLLDWSTVFGLSEPAQVEAYCRDNDLGFEWGPQGRLVTQRRRDAVLRHEVTGSMNWFNQAHIFHSTNMPEEVRAVLLRDGTAAEDLPYDTLYGDGQPIPDDHLNEVREVHADCEIAFTWQHGDVMWLDNIAAAHGRRPFAGPRRILVAMSQRDPAHAAA